MYIPPAFREEDLDTLHGLMRRHSFATLVTLDGSRPFATHLPLLLDPQRGPFGTLRGHVARANPQGRHLEGDEEVLAIFQGPHAYMSPSWYETALSVPTWNYVAVHAYGTPRLLDAEETLVLLRDLVQEYESGFEQPWPFDLPDEFTRKLLQAITGFEIEVTRLEGKQKLSQNRSEADRLGAESGLRTLGDPNSLAIADLMGRL